MFRFKWMFLSCSIRHWKKIGRPPCKQVWKASGWKQELFGVDEYCLSIEVIIVASSLQYFRALAGPWNSGFGGISVCWSCNSCLLQSKRTGLLYPVLRCGCRGGQGCLPITAREAQGIWGCLIAILQVVFNSIYFRWTFQITRIIQLGYSIRDWMIVCSVVSFCSGVISAYYMCVPVFLWLPWVVAS